MFGLGLGKLGTSGSRSGGASWSPSVVFAGSEVGSVIDFSMVAGLYQDHLGTVAVSAAGDPVGLALDYKLGAPVLGPELVTNGGGSSTAGWTTPYGGTLVSSGGVFVLTSAGGSGTNTLMQRTFATEIGKTYVISASMRAVSGDLVLARAQEASGGYAIKASTQTYTGGSFVTKQAIFIASTTSTFVNVQMSANANGDSCEVQNISVREITGCHAIQATAGDRPAWAATGNSKWCNYETSDLHTITFPSSLGSACTVARAVVGGAPTILTGQTIGTSYTSSVDTPCLFIVNRALTGAETAGLTNWLTAKGSIPNSSGFVAGSSYTTVSGIRRYSYQSTFVDSVADASASYDFDVLLPDSYNPANTYPLIVVLGVEPVPALYADEIQTIKTAGLHNTHNAIFVRANTKTYPWWGARYTGFVDYERLVRDGLVPWMRANFPIVAGRQGVSLLGYSKGGWGAYSLILRNPTAFGYAACWDAPLTSSYAAMSGAYGLQAIGSADQWALYSPSAILAANLASVNDKTRLVLTGYNLFDTEVVAFSSLLTSNSVGYTYDRTSRASHNADSGWMAGTVGALAALW